MYYEINIALNGRHLFATAPRSITTYDELKTILRVFKAKFPANEGYEISASEYPQTSYRIDVSPII